MKTHPALLILGACTGAVAERPTPGIESSYTLTSAAALADSASICWQRFSRGVALTAGWTTLGVAARVDTVRDTIRVPGPPAPAPRPFAFGPFSMYQGPDAAKGFTA